MSGPPKWADYGETSYARGCMAMEVFVCHTTPVQPGPPPADTMAAHLEYQKQIEAKGKLFLAGPLSDEAGEVMSGGGMIVYVAENMTAARALADADPMHSAGVRTYNMQAWRLNEGAPMPGLRLSSRSFSLR